MQPTLQPTNLETLLEAIRAGQYTDAARLAEELLEEAWWDWHDEDSARWYGTMEEAEAAAKSWARGESDDGPDREWLDAHGLQSVSH